jgi:hypothetical protein
LNGVLNSIHYIEAKTLLGAKPPYGWTPNSTLLGEYETIGASPKSDVETFGVASHFFEKFANQKSRTNFPAI